MIGITVVVDLLLDLTDAMSTAVLGGSDGDTLKFSRRSVCRRTPQPWDSARS